MAPTKREVEAAAKAMLKEQAAQMGEGWGEPALDSEVSLEALAQAEAALTAAEKVRKIGEGNARAVEEWNRWAVEEARTQESRDRHEANIIAAHGELADPTCPNTAHKFSHCDCQPETGQPDTLAIEIREDAREQGRQEELARILTLIEGKREAGPKFYTDEAVDAHNRAIDEILTAIKGDSNE